MWAVGSVVSHPALSGREGRREGGIEGGVGREGRRDSGRVYREGGKEGEREGI